MQMRTAMWMLAGMVAATPLGACSGTVDGGSGPTAGSSTSGSTSIGQGSSSGSKSGVGSSSVGSTKAGSSTVASSSTTASGPDSVTTSPIKHVIVIIGENRTFDHVFATYKPKAGQKVDNLLSKGIVNEDGTPGPNFSKAYPEERPSTRSRARTSSAPAARRRTAFSRPSSPAARRRRTSPPSARRRRTRARLPADYVPGPHDRRDRPHQRHRSTRASPERYDAPARPVPAHPGHRVRRLLREPRAPLLPDVAAARLQRRPRHRAQPVGLPQRPLPLGRDDRSAPATTA